MSINWLVQVELAFHTSGADTMRHLPTAIYELPSIHFSSCMLLRNFNNVSVRL